MTIALARPVLIDPCAALPAALSALRPAVARTAGRYAAAPRSLPHLVRPSVTGPRVGTRRAKTDAVPAPRLRITRRGRAVLTVLTAVPLSAGAVLLVSATDAPASTASVSDSVLTGAAAPGSPIPVPSLATVSSGTDHVQVASGDSLWSVAETIAPDADPREVIDDLVQTNGLTGFDVYPGQRLEIPSRY